MMRHTMMVAVLTLTLATTGCGITGPKLHFGRTTTPIAGGAMPGVEGNLADPETGATIATGSFSLNPAAAVTMLTRYAMVIFGGAAPESAPADAE